MSEETKNEMPVKFAVVPQRSIQEITHLLKTKLALRHIALRRQGGNDIPYLEWNIAAYYMDIYAPGWNYEISNMQVIAGKLVMIVRVYVPCIEGSVWREATGCEDEDKTGFGDAFSNAEAMALKRAFAKFGLGFELYTKAEQIVKQVQEYKRTGGNAQKPISNPVNTNNPQTNQPPKTNTSQSNPSSDAEMISEKQIGFLTSLITKSEDDFAEAILEFTSQRTEMIDAMTKKEGQAAINYYNKSK